MLKYIGIVSPNGVPIISKTMVKMPGKDYLTSLISALSMFSESIGVGS